MTEQLPVTSNSQNNYWGFWATLGLTIVIFMVFSVIQSLVLVGYMFVKEGISFVDALGSDPAVGIESLLANYALNGDAISVSEIPAAMTGVALVILFILLRKSISIKNYLELSAPTLKQFFLFIGLMFLAMMLMEGVNIWLDRPTPEFMTKVYSSTKNLPLLWIAVGVAAPIFEEVLFRGFFFDGIRNSSFGTTGAVLLTSATWAVIHMQYGWFEIVSIFFIGILLAIAKLKTKSLYIPIAMHMLMNLTASLGMELSL